MLSFNMNQPNDFASPLPSSSDSFSRSAISLNNISVSLLERQCYDQAVATLRDAVLLLRTTTTSTFPSDFGNVQCLCDESLHQAYLRLAKTNQTRCDDQVQINTVTTTSAVMMPWTEHELLISVSSQFDALRIEDYDCNDASEIIAAVLLHNLGIAYYCLSKVSRTGSSSELRNVEKAIRFLRISYSLLHGAKADILGLNFLFLICLQVTVVKTLVSIFFEQNRTNEAHPYRLILNFLKETIAESKKVVETTNKPAAAA
jgi:hypothetical protein